MRLRMNDLALEPFSLSFCTLIYFGTGDVPFVAALAAATVLNVLTIIRGFMKISAKNRAVLVTGCDTGFGHRLAVALHCIGFTVFAGCLDDESEGGVVLHDIGKETGRLFVLKMDVTSQEQVDRAYRFVEDHLPQRGLWGLVNNAGIGTLGYLEWLPCQVYEKVAAVNLFGTIRVTRAFLPLIRQREGRVVNVSSTLGRIVTPFLGAYCITKHAIEAFSDVLRLEMKQFNVKVITVEPGNYMSATGITGKEGMNTARHFWEQLDDSALQAYSKENLDKQLLSGEIFLKMARTDISPVVETMCTALCARYPSTHYFVASLLDMSSAYFIQYFPAYITDPFFTFFQDRLLPFLANFL